MSLLRSPWQRAIVRPRTSPLKSPPQEGRRFTTATKSVLHLMPLGASVTRGVGSSDGTGYRKALLDMLRQHGLNAQMVGSRRDGAMANNDHEGWRGWRIDEIERKARKSVQGLSHSPDLFLVNAGSNDCLQSFGIADVGKRMENMLEGLWMACPRSTVLLSTLIVNADREVDSVVMRVNEESRALVRKKAAEKKIVLVDMHAGEGPGVQDLGDDGVHPNDEGCRKMAKLWFRGIQEAMQEGFIDGSKYKLSI